MYILLALIYFLIKYYNFKDELLYNLVKLRKYYWNGGTMEKNIHTINGIKVKENYYKVNEKGEVINLKGQSLGSVNSSGLIYVKLQLEDGKYKTFIRSRIIAEYFLDNYSEDLLVYHLNNNRTDDSKENLILRSKNNPLVKVLSKEEQKMKIENQILKYKNAIKKLKKQLESLEEEA